MIFKYVLLITLLILSVNVLSNASASVNSPDSLVKKNEKATRIYNTTRLTTEKPLIDGILNDPCWETGEWAGDFTQWIPKEGAKPTFPTYLKILYDDKNIYVAICSIDYEPHKISKKAGRRDELSGDAVGVNFDSYHDFRTGFEFNVTASGQKIDLILTNPMNADFNWNAVWSAKVGMEDSGWVAEYEIPLSQLRYSNDYEQVWGMHCWRWIDRLQEESDWEPQSSTGPGMLYQFGEIHGIKGLPRSRRIEIMPYLLGELKTFKKDALNPFAKSGTDWSPNAGIDAKIGLSSNFTADITISPDFGQVESDPSVMNLTAFETFYEEKRPFFLEGKNIFNFDFDNSTIFHTRRIGEFPTYSPQLDSNEYINYPDNTTILNAVKLSGKTSNGFSVGILQSITANEIASIDSAGIKKNVGVKPLTNFALARIQQDFKQGNTVIGGIFTSTNRFIKDTHLNFLNRNAYSGGIDFLHQWNDKEFYIDAKLIGSFVYGSNTALTNLQRSSAHYFQRPDVNHIVLDTNRNNLSGLGGLFKIGKGSKGFWRYSTGLLWHSPGLDLNDAGYMQTADFIKNKNSVYYFVNQPVSIFRTYNIGIDQSNNWDFGMNYLFSDIELDIYLEFLNKWAVSTSTEYITQSLDTRLLRGGYAVIVPSVLNNYFFIRTDYSKKVYFYFNLNFSSTKYNYKNFFTVQPGITITPVNSLRFSMEYNYSGNSDNIQYVESKTYYNEYRYILGKIDQKTMYLTFRIDYYITPELSVQYYGSPFISNGKYSDFKSVINPKAANYYERFNTLKTVLNINEYNVYEDGNLTVDYSFNNPDFSFNQFRSNFVFRWEYRPGSQLYLVWSQERTEFIQPGNIKIKEGIKNIFNSYPNNIFLLKLNYWFSI